MKPEIFCSHNAVVRTTTLNEKRHPKNPNKHPDSQIKLLAKIIKEQGWRQSITVSNRSGFIVRGEGRLDAALLLGLKEAPVDYQDYDSEESELADLIADNRIAELAEMNHDLLKADLIELNDKAFDMELAGFDDIALTAVIADGINDPNDEWQGMPEFVQEDQSAYRTLIVHFADQKAVDNFLRITGLSLTDKTKYAWYPEQQIVKAKDKRYISEA